MRKTQVALAALALVASSAAMAGGVKMAGCVDASIVNTDAGTTLGGAGDGCASQWGLYGSEDIGGMKASFNLEGGLNIGNGTTGNGGSAGNSSSIFNRLANVSVGTEAATVTLGMAKSAWIEAAGGGLTAYGMNGVGVPALAILNGNLSGTSQSGGFFVGNIAGVSGNVGGISYNVQTSVAKSSTSTAWVQTAASTGSSVISGANDSYTALRVSAPAGPATVNFGYENRKNTPATAITAGNIEYTNWVASASLPLEGGFSLNAAYAKQNAGAGQTNTTYAAGRNVAGDQTGYILGAGYKMSDAVGFGLTYAKNNGNTSMIAASAQYNLSGNTALYANLADFDGAVVLNNAGNAQPAAAAGSTTTYTGKVFSVGLHHAF